MNKRLILLKILIINLITTVNIELLQAAPVGLDLARMENQVLIDIDNKEQLGKIRHEYENDSYNPLTGCNLRDSSNINDLEYITQKVQQIEDANKKQINISILSESEIQQLFQELSSQSHIPFGYPEDGCYARAQEMSLILDKKGITTGKVFIEGDLRVDTTNSPKGYVEWWYHVAPIVFVNKDNKLEPYVLDPSLFDKAVPLTEWTEIQTKHNPKQNETVYFTKRFNYTPMDKSLDLEDYNISDIISGEKTMTEYIKIQLEREKKRLEEFKKKKNLANDLKLIEDFFNSTDIK